MHIAFMTLKDDAFGALVPAEEPGDSGDGDGDGDGDGEME